MTAATTTTATTRTSTVSRAGAAVLTVVAATLAVTLGTASLATAGAGDPLILGTTNASGPTTYLNWDKAGYPVREAGIAAVGARAGAVFATNEEYMGQQTESITGVQGYGNDVGGYFYGVDTGTIARAEYVGLEARASEVGVKAIGATAVEATGEEVGLQVTGDTAIRADGAVSFSSAGLLVIPTGATSATVAVESDVMATTKVLATAQSAGGQVQRVRRNQAADTITIQLSAPATQAVTVAYFVIQ